MEEMFEGYRESIEKLTKQIDRVNREAKGLSGWELYLKKREYSLLCEQRKELKDILSYLEGYYEK